MKVFRSFYLFVALMAFSLVNVEGGNALKNPEPGGLELKSSGKIAFGPEGLLLIADPKAASVVAVETGDKGPRQKLRASIDDIESVLAKSTGSKSVLIVDMAVNPVSGNIYFSATERPGNDPAILCLAADGHVENVDLSGLPHVRIQLPTAENAQLRNVTDLSWGKDSVIVAGQSSEEFANKIYQIPAPLEHGVNAQFMSAETYHVAHQRWETKAPIQSFIPWEEDGDMYVVGAFACTPIAKFPLSDIGNSGKVRGTSVIELGSGNRPRDMFVYESDGEQWLVTNTQRFKDNLFGPSKFWAARVKMEYLEANEPDSTNENAPRRNVEARGGREAKGIEVMETLFGAVMVSQFDNAEVVVLRETDSDDADAPHRVELVDLP